MYIVNLCLCVCFFVVFILWSSLYVRRMGAVDEVILEGECSRRKREGGGGGDFPLLSSSLEGH